MPADLWGGDHSCQRHRPTACRVGAVGLFRATGEAVIEDHKIQPPSTNAWIASTWKVDPGKILAPPRGGRRAGRVGSASATLIHRAHEPRPSVTKAEKLAGTACRCDLQGLPVPTHSMLPILPGLIDRINGYCYDADTRRFRRHSRLCPLPQAFVMPHLHMDVCGGSRPLLGRRAFLVASSLGFAGLRFGRPALAATTSSTARPGKADLPRLLAATLAGACYLGGAMSRRRCPS